MAYVIAEPCIGTKDSACVDACPVDCIHPKKDEPQFEGVDQLFIDPLYQRCGIGSALLVQALKSAPGRTTLHVFEANQNARAFYERHGFCQRDHWMNMEAGAIDLLYVRE